MRPVPVRSLLAVALAAALAACTSTTAIGSKGESLSLFKPADQSLARGSATTVNVIVRRDALPGAIDLRIDRLPAGVSVTGGAPQVEAGSNFAKFGLEAAPDAPLVTSHPVTITARAETGVSVTQTFLVSVTAR
jgi:hypothetical protein